MFAFHTQAKANIPFIVQTSLFLLVLVSPFLSEPWKIALKHPGTSLEVLRPHTEQDLSRSFHQLLLSYPTFWYTATPRFQSLFTLHISPFCSICFCTAHQNLHDHSAMFPSSLEQFVPLCLFKYSDVNCRDNGHWE